MLELRLLDFTGQTTGEEESEDLQDAEAQRDASDENQMQTEESLQLENAALRVRTSRMVKYSIFWFYLSD